MSILYFCLSKCISAREPFPRGLSNQTCVCTSWFKSVERNDSCPSFFCYREVLEGTSSCPQGWGRVHDKGVVCLSNTKNSRAPIEIKRCCLLFLPILLNMNMTSTIPQRFSFDMYTEPFVPHINARIAQGKRGRLWENAEAYERGDRPNWRLKEERVPVC